MDRIRNTYVEETHELLKELEAALLDLEETPEDAELVDRVFRAMHTIKGSGAMVGFDNITAFTHEIETVFDLVREGQLPFTRELVDLTLAACDQIGKMVDEEETDEDHTAEITALFQRMLPEDDTQEEARPASDPDAEGPEDQQPTVCYRIRFRPHPAIFA